MEPFIPPPLRRGYLRRFTTWLAAFLVSLAIAMGAQAWEMGSTTAFASDNLWTMAKIAAGMVVLAAVFACVPSTSKDD